MSRLSITGVVAAVALTVFASSAPASDVYTYDKLTYLTFTAPVQVPGVTLPAGTYRFHLTNPETSRNVLQVLSNDGAIVYAMFHTIPDSRTTLTDESMVSFRETPAGVPPAAKSLFYGGEYRGYEFVYPKGGPNMTAEVMPQPGIAYTPFPPAALAEPEPAVEPAPAPMPEPAVEPEPAPAPPAEPLAELPKTASPLPLVATGGFASLVFGLALGLWRWRVN